MKMSKITTRKAWTAEENLFIAQLYNGMYIMQLGGESFVKAPLVRNAAERFGRSKGSIECKLMNVSAIYKNVLNLDFVKGYKPLNNYNGDLVEAVEQARSGDNIRYCITIQEGGARVMPYPHNATGTHETERGARDHLIAVICNNSAQQVAEFYGDIEKAKVLPVRCYQGGDPKQTYFGGA